MKTFAVASGKGGTGKTLFAVNLAILLAKQFKTAYLDVDVEGPNGYIFLRPEINEEFEATIANPRLKESTCPGCGECQQFCQFNAIISLPNKVMVFDELCSGCTGCELACPYNALEIYDRPIGKIRVGESAIKNLEFIDGKINIGEARSKPIIEQIKKRSEKLDAQFVVIDAPPGSSCPVLEAISDTDFVLLVTEPTPFGLHDLQLVLGAAKELNRKTGIIINRADIGDEKPILELAEQMHAPILGRLNFEKKYAKTYASGRNIVEELPETKEFFLNVLSQILQGIK